MQNIHLHNLRPGMIVGRNILGVDGTLLLAAGVQLTSHYIKKLHQLGIPSVYIWDERTLDVDIRSPVQDHTRLQTARLMKKILKNINSKIGPKDNLNLDEYIPQIKEAVENILQDISTSGKLVMDFLELKNAHDYTFLHSVNVCILAIMMGKQAGLKLATIRELGIGTLLHDVGKALVPGNILTKPKPLTPEEYQQMKKHTTLGYELLCRTKEITPASAQISLEHHERVDGRGYPYSLRDQQISFLGRLSAICDVYDALISDRVYRKRYLPHQAAKFITSGSGTHFDQQLVKIFTKCIAMYPLGSVVHLNNGQLGVVVEVKPEQTTRPIIRIFKDQEGRTLSQPIDIDLTHHPQIEINYML
ncbi:MAG: HD-GYP domain-containing protein [bacterium]|jgi:HD-GYP domain-containing protein (c-di-GMP phosphodiesterase class II)